MNRIIEDACRSNSDRLCSCGVVDGCSTRRHCAEWKKKVGVQEEMEIPITTATRVVRTGDVAIAVTVSLLVRDKYVVSISDPWVGSGVAVGKWATGFIACDLPTRSEIDYFEKTFGLCNMDTIKPTDIILWNKMYLDALSQVNKEASDADKTGHCRVRSSNR